MTIKEVLEAQLDAAIAGLVHARAGIATEMGKERFNEVEQQLETAVFHLQDIQFNWLSLSNNRPI